jgi:hypothetical protein
MPAREITELDALTLLARVDHESHSLKRRPAKDTSSSISRASPPRTIGARHGSRHATARRVLVDAGPGGDVQPRDIGCADTRYRGHDEDQEPIVNPRSYAEERTVSTRTTDDVRRIPIAHAPHPEMPCGHSVHIGSCPHCQRAQLARWAEQLADASRRNGWFHVTRESPRAGLARGARRRRAMSSKTASATPDSEIARLQRGHHRAASAATCP